VSENKRHSQTNVAVNAKSPGSVATDLKLVKFLIAVFFYKFIVESVSEKKLKIGEHLAELQATRWVTC